MGETRSNSRMSANQTQPRKLWGASASGVEVRGQPLSERGKKALEGRAATLQGRRKDKKK